MLDRKSARMPRCLESPAMMTRSDRIVRQNTRKSHDCLYIQKHFPAVETFPIPFFFIPQTSPRSTSRSRSALSPCRATRFGRKSPDIQRRMALGPAETRRHRSILLRLTQRPRPILPRPFPAPCSRLHSRSLAVAVVRKASWPRPEADRCLSARWRRSGGGTWWLRGRGGGTRWDGGSTFCRVT